MSKEISLHCPINSLSYGVIGRNLILELKKLGVKVNLFPIGEISTETKNEAEAIKWSVANSQFSDLNCPTVKIWHQYDVYSEFGTGKKYGFPIFELDTFSQKEIDSLSRVEVINCSSWAENICKGHGINTAGVVPLGYNPEVFYPSIYPYTDTIKILTIGKWEIRKGHYELPTILKDVFYGWSYNPYSVFPFDEKRRIELSVCCTNPFLSQFENKSWEDYYKHVLQDVCEVKIIPRLETQEQVRDLISANHITFLPSHAEGWGLEALETLACGRHLVTTKYAGATEYFDKYDFDIELEPAIDGKWFFGQGNWLKFTDNIISNIKDDLFDALRESYKENSYGIEKAKNFTWEKSAKKLCNVLGIKIND